MAVQLDAEPATGPGRIPRVDFEFTTGCDHRCGHCYNVWNTPADGPTPATAAYPRGALETEEQWAMMARVLDETGAQHVTVTGGEPLLRRDAVVLLERLCARVRTVQLITNGSHVTPEIAARFARAGLRSVQLTLLSADRDTHDRLKGAVCFDDTVRAALELREAGVPVQCCFVALRENAGMLAGVMELCLVLGIRGLSYNRMSPTGWAVDEIERLMPEIAAVEADLATANRLGPRYQIRVSTAMPIPPCLIRMGRYPHVQFGFCSVGSHSPNIVVDPLGNVRSCNLSSEILGNTRAQPFAEILANPYLERFPRTVPEPCRGCAYERSCQGGCKESGAATYGALGELEPFVRQGMPA